MVSEQHQTRAFVYAFFTSLITASAAAAIKFVGATVAVEFVTFWQFAIGLAATSVMVLRKEGSWRSLLAVERDDRGVMLVRGLAGLGAFFSFYFAITKIPLVDATLLRFSGPLFVPGIAFVWLRQRTDLLSLVFVVVGFVGVYITLQPESGGITGDHLIGFSSAFFIAISMVATNRLKRYSSTAVLFYYYLIATLGMLPLALLEWQPVTPLEGLAIVYVGGSIVVALYLYNMAFTLSSASVVAPMTYLSVVHAGILGWIFWDHIPAPISMVGMLIVAACGITMTLRSGVKARAAAAAPSRN